MVKTLFNYCIFNEEHPLTMYTAQMLPSLNEFLELHSAPAAYNL